MNIKQKLIKEVFENYIDRATGKIYLLDKAQLQPKLEQLLDDYKKQVSVKPVVKVQIVGMVDAYIKEITKHLTVSYVKNNSELYNHWNGQLEAFGKVKKWIDSNLSA